MIVDLAPNTTEVLTAAVIGTGGTAHATLAAGIPGNYVLADAGEGARCGLSSHTLTTGQIVAGIQIVLGAQAHDGDAIAPVVAAVFNIAGDPYAAVVNTTARDTAELYASNFLARAFSQSELDEMQLQVFLASPTFGPASAVRFTAAYVQLAIADPPTVAVTGPTGASVATSTPTVTWTYTAGADGGPQSKYRVRVFTAAQYGAGGFDPATSTATWDSGLTTGAAASRQITTPLTNAVTYRAYVQVSHTINAQDASSAWAYSQFTTSFATSDISTVTASADNATGKITVTVNRNTGTESWDSIDLERSDDAGATWVPVRGATRQGATNTWLTTWGANSAVVVDYEAGNGVSAVYRARATNNNAGSDVTGAWVSSSSVSWSSTDVWLKAPLDPSLSDVVQLAGTRPALTRPRSQGVFAPIGRTSRVVVSDVAQSANGVLVLETTTFADGNALAVLLGEPVLMLQYPASVARDPAMYIAPGEVLEDPVSVADELTIWSVQFVEVDMPADET